jgi:hypothetical protein
MVVQVVVLAVKVVFFQVVQELQAKVMLAVHLVEIKTVVVVAVLEQLAAMPQHLLAVLVEMVVLVQLLVLP